MSAAAHFTDAEKKITMAGVLIVFLLSALDQTIVSTAMPVIISQLHGLELYSWVTTAYLLSSTAMVPVWGKLGDIYGRKIILVWGIGLFLAGSWLSGLAGEFGDLPILGGGMVQLIVFRALQGLGGGALFTTAFGIIADLYPPRERGKLSGLFIAVFSLASLVGPLLGGYFTDHGTINIGGHEVAGWRWVFYLNVPMAILALFMVLVKMPKLSHGKKGTIDYLGAVLSIATVMSLMLALTFGGQKYAWGSPQILGLFAGFVVGAGLFVWVETHAKDPIIHLELFKNKVFAWGNTAAFFSSMSFMSTVAFLPLFMQIGQGVKATTSGLSTMPLMAGLAVSAIVSGRLVAKTGKYKMFLLFGVVVVALGTSLLSLMHDGTSRMDLGWRMAILGVGLGPLQSLFNLAIQNAVPMTQIGVVSSANQFFRQIGSTVGVAVFGTLITNRMNAGLAEISPGLTLSKLRSLGAMTPTDGQAMSPAMAAGANMMKHVVSSSVTSTIGLSLIAVALCFLATLMLPELPMKDRHNMAPPKDEVIPGEIHV